jgi:glucokinase
MTKSYALGIDIGGTNTVFGIVSKNGEIIFENVTSTKAHATPSTLVDYIYQEISKKGYLEQLIGIAIGAPNGNYYTGNIEYAPNLHWKGIVPLASLFAEKFGVKTTLTNDANAAAVGEMFFGDAKDLKNFVTITLGTGVGSGVIIDGKLVYGEEGMAGEYGHIRVVHNGRLCGCGRKGCLETYTSATGVARSVEEFDSPNKASSSLLQLSQPTSKDVVEAAEKGDLFAQEIIEYTTEILGNALADFACFSNPKAYILFGGLAHIGESFAKRISHYMNEAALEIYKNKIEVRLSALQDTNAAVLGTAAIAFEEQ